MRSRYFYRRKCALVLAILLILDTLRPLTALALTSGPSQPEVQGFKAIETTNMVDMFTGDFSYNLPLFEIDGYPLNMSYNSNARMEDESSWVGLGWSLNPGAINRDLRGLPDDFKNDIIEKDYNMKEDVTIGGNLGAGIEIFGLGGTLGAGIFWNNKKGYGVEAKLGLGFKLAGKNSSVGGNISFNSQNGVDFGLNLGLGRTQGDATAKLTASTNINSRQGIKAINFGMSLKQNLTNERVIDDNISASADLGGSTYFPTNPMPMSNTSFTFHGTVGAEFFGGHPNFNLDGYGTAQRLMLKNQKQNAFGYLYNFEGQKRSTNLMDCNRDNQMVYRADMPTLPISYGTYDNFSVSGQGVGGMYRLCKNDVGVLHSNYAINNSMSGSLGVELGAGNLFHGGFDGAGTRVVNTSSAWYDNNTIRNVAGFTEDNKDYQGQYFKDASDKTVDDQAFYNQIGGTNPAFVNLGLSFTNATPVAERKLRVQKNKTNVSTNAVTKVLKKTQRGKRYGVMSYLTKSEADSFGLDKKIRSYNANTLYYNNGICPVPSLVSEIGKSHHIKEINILKSDGSRYVFGLPVYNIFQKEVSFSVNENTPRGESQAYTSYTAGTDNSTNNSRGRDNHYESQKIPSHANSYLLTGVLSDDYVDVKEDGITDDDLGNAVKFNYSKLTDMFKWRTPFMKDTARLLQGMKVDKLDDKGSYVYGEKQIWYMHSIESRNMIAQFYTSDRQDANGVADENGGISTSVKLRKLDSIRVYSKSDLLKNGVIAVPIKQVNFEYDYTNCPQTTNSVASNKGKLTLKKVYFTFGNNGKGKLNAYQFRYKQFMPTPNTAISYDTVKVDRWGYFKQHPVGFPGYADYPYSVQDSVLANKAAGAWNMDTIFLPSGGRIVVNYESDDYAYVQNKRASQMFFIKGFAKDTIATNFVVGSVAAKSLYAPSGTVFGSQIVNNNYIVIDVSAYSSILNSVANPKQEVQKIFFEDIKEIYFKAKVKLTTDVNSNEYVTGYASYDKSKVHYNGVTKNIFIPISDITDGGKSINPVTLAAFQNMRLNVPDLAYSLSGQTSSINAPKKESAKRIIMGLATFLRDVSDLIKGFNKVRLERQWSKEVDVNNQSWIRLANPLYKKLGGGTRVKTLTVSDNWTIANGEGENNYTQTFSYKTNLNGKIISSGVAAYEPQLGGEENTLKSPMPYKEKIKLAPDNTFYAEEPIGESFYPSPTVGYSEVKVESVYPSVKRSGTGYTLNKFYTAKDFPTMGDFTNIVAGTVMVKPSVLSSIFKINSIEQVAVSQGFAIETNDMHGKPKEEAVYNQQGALVSATNYYYKVDNESATILHLNNNVQVVKPDGTIETQAMGVDIDIWQEMQEEQTNTQTRGIAFNTDGFLAFIFPIVIPIPLPVFQNSKKSLKTAITTKHIKRMGLLDKVVKTVDGSTLATQNVAYDIETGDVILTKTENEFNDPLYNFTYPAHWAYDGMGPAYKNVGNIFNGISFDVNGVIQGVSNASSFFTEGDELILQKGKESIIGIFNVYRKNATDLAVLDRFGAPFNGLNKGTFTVKIKRSGRKNKSSMPIGSIAALVNPVVGNTISIGNNTKVYQAEAKEYKDYWQMKCKQTPFVTAAGDTLFSFASQFINPYMVGTKGNWRSWRNFVQFNQRNVNSTPNIRTDGFIPNFAPYWSYDGTINRWRSNANSSWVRSDSIHLYDGRGNEIESSDANNIPSSAYYGFNGTQVVAVVSNSRYKEMTYDSFEDYDFKNACTPTISYVNKNLLFYDSLKSNNNFRLTSTRSHTGKYALELGANTQFKVNALLNNEFCVKTGPCNNCTSITPTSSVTGNIGGSGNIATSYGTNINKCDDCLPNFYPLSGKKYAMTVWVATDSSLNYNLKPKNIDATVNTVDFNGVASVPFVLKAQGPVIEGWQKMEGSFILPNTSSQYVSLKFNNTNAVKCYLDDIRFLPFNAKMKAYAYDGRSRRLMAELDENHYATFYEYDDEGILVRIKRETETGIQTVKEARNFLRPNN
jgi:hypothetical protein